MKRRFFLLLSILTLFLINKNVYAKDTVYSLNKYKEEKLDFIIDSYNEESKKDGNIVAGTFLKETIKENEKDYNDYQIIIIKYNKKGKIVWEYSYGKNKEDKINTISYSYNDNGPIDGYLISLSKSYNIISTENVEKDENQKNTPIFLKLDLDGNLLEEKDINLNENTEIKRIIPSYQNNTVNGYYSISFSNSKKIELTKYALDLSLEWNKEYSSENEITSIDIIPYNVDENTTNYIFLRTEKKEDEELTNIELIDKDGNIIKKLQENVTNYSNTKLLNTSSGYILYGVTDEVKLKNGKDSYFIKKYNQEFEEEWEYFGTISIDKNKSISLKETSLDKYFLLYTTTSNSIEVVTIEKEGTLINKIKKIKNDYYTVENFNIKKNTLYLIGQINCPEDDNCEYDKNSLYLVSDEDKVIEVKEEDSNNALLFVSILIVVIIIIVTIRNKKRRLNESK